MISVITNIASAFMLLELNIEINLTEHNWLIYKVNEYFALLSGDVVLGMLSLSLLLSTILYMISLIGTGNNILDLSLKSFVLFLKAFLSVNLPFILYKAYDMPFNVYYTIKGFSFIKLADIKDYLNHLSDNLLNNGITGLNDKQAVYVNKMAFKYMESRKTIEDYTSDMIAFLIDDNQEKTSFIQDHKKFLLIASLLIASLLAIVVLSKLGFFEKILSPFHSYYEKLFKSNSDINNLTISYAQNNDEVSARQAEIIKILKDMCEENAAKIECNNQNIKEIINKISDLPETSAIRLVLKRLSRQVDDNCKIINNIRNNSFDFGETYNYNQSVNFEDLGEGMRLGGSISNPLEVKEKFLNAISKLEESSKAIDNSKEIIEGAIIHRSDVINKGKEIIEEVVPKYSLTDKGKEIIEEVVPKYSLTDKGKEIIEEVAVISRMDKGKEKIIEEGKEMILYPFTEPGKITMSLNELLNRNMVEHYVKHSKKETCNGFNYELLLGKLTLKDAITTSLEMDLDEVFDEAKKKHFIFRIAMQEIESTPAPTPTPTPTPVVTTFYDEENIGNPFESDSSFDDFGVSLLNLIKKFL